MRLVIHPGWSKTGTSAIQNYFAENWDANVGRGLLYPKSGRFIDNAHHGLALAVAPKPGLQASESLDDILKNIGNEIDVIAPTDVVISSELSPIYFDSDPMKKFLDRFDDIEIVFVVRPQSEIIVSLYKQIIKDASIEFKGSVFDLFLENCHWLNFAKEIARWKDSSALYRPLIKVAVYSPASLIKDFSTLSGLGAVFEFDRRPNESPSDLAIAVMEETMDFRWGLNNLLKQEQFVRFVAENTQGITIDNYPLAREEAAIIDAMFAASNASIASEYLGRDVLFQNLTPRPNPIDARQSKLVRAFANLLTKSFNS